MGLLEGKCKIYAVVVENAKVFSLSEEIKSKSDKGSVFYTAQFKNYISLKFYRKNLLLDHQGKIVNGKNHTNGIEGFWSYVREWLLKYHGASKQNFFFILISQSSNIILEKIICLICY